MQGRGEAGRQSCLAQRRPLALGQGAAGGRQHERPPVSGDLEFRGERLDVHGARRRLLPRERPALDQPAGLVRLVDRHPSGLQLFGQEAGDGLLDLPRVVQGEQGVHEVHRGRTAGEADRLRLEQRLDAVVETDQREQAGAGEQAEPHEQQVPGVQPVLHRHDAERQRETHGPDHDGGALRQGDRGEDHQRPDAPAMA